MDLLPEPMLPIAYHQRTIGGNKAFHNFANDYSHISDPNLRRRLALSEIDKVPFGLYRKIRLVPYERAFSSFGLSIAGWTKMADLYIQRQMCAP
jgi:hypothetical protein